MAKVTMPQLGESVAEGTIGKWLKQPGDHVDKYEPLLEVITDKVNAEVPSPFEGVLKEILAEEGATVPNNAEIAVIETADDGAGDAPARRRAEAAAAAAEPAAGRRARPTDRPAPTSRTRPSRRRRAPAHQLPARPSPPRRRLADGRRRRAAPRQRRPRRPHDPGRPPPAPRARPDARTRSSGTGGGGRITRDDVLAVVEQIRTGGAAPVPVMAPRPPARRPRPRRPRPASGSAPAAGLARSPSRTAPTRSSCR